MSNDDEVKIRSTVIVEYVSTETLNVRPVTKLNSLNSTDTAGMRFACVSSSCKEIKR